MKILDEALAEMTEISKAYGSEKPKKAEDGDSVQATVTTGKGESQPGMDEKSNFDTESKKSKPTSKSMLLVEEAVEKATWPAAYVNDLPDSAFLYVEDGEKDDEGKTTPRNKRHFPVKDKAGKLDPAHVRNAIARAPQAKLADSVKDGVQTKAKKLLDGLKKAVEKALIEKDADYTEHLAAIRACYSMLDAACCLICEHNEITPDVEGIVHQVMEILGGMTVEEESRERSMAKRTATEKSVGRTIRRNLDSQTDDWPHDLNSAEFLGDDIRKPNDRPNFGRDLTRATRY